MRKKAFTLTELLVVVVIIGVLSAVVLPKFTKMLDTRKATEAESVMRAVRNEQEARCTLDKDYTGVATKLASLPKSSKHFSYNLDEQGITATGPKYTLKIPSYTDGRICCESGCDELNKDYPKCSELAFETAHCSVPPNEAPADNCDKDLYKEESCDVRYPGENRKGIITYKLNANCEYDEVEDTCKKEEEKKECDETKKPKDETRDCHAAEDEGDKYCGEQKRAAVCSAATDYEWKFPEDAEAGWGACSLVEGRCGTTKTQCDEDAKPETLTQDCKTGADNEGDRSCGEQTKEPMCSADTNYEWKYPDEWSECKEVEGKCSDGCEVKEGEWVEVGYELLDCEEGYQGCGRADRYKCESGNYWRLLDGLGEGCELTQQEKETCSCEQKPAEKQPCKFGYDGEVEGSFKCENGKWELDGKWDTSKCKNNKRWTLSVVEHACSSECEGKCGQWLTDATYGTEVQYNIHHRIGWKPDQSQPCEAYGQTYTMEECTGIIHMGGQVPAWWGHAGSYYSAKPRKRVLTLRCSAREERNDTDRGFRLGDLYVDSYMLVNAGCPTNCETAGVCDPGIMSWSCPGLNQGCYWNPPEYQSNCGASLTGVPTDTTVDEWLDSLSGWGSGTYQEEEDDEYQNNAYKPEDEQEVNCYPKIDTQKNPDGTCYTIFQFICNGQPVSTRIEQVQCPPLMTDPYVAGN